MGIKLKDFKNKFDKALKEGVEEATSKKCMDEIGEFSVDLIKKRTARGFGVETSGGSPRRFARYTDGYVEQRKRLKSDGKLKGTPKKVTLRQTGKMMDESLDYVIDENTIRIGMSDDENAKKAAFVSKKRPFLNLSKAEIKQVIKKVRNKIEDIFKKKF